LFPAFFSQALAGGGAPFDAGGHLLFINISFAFLALYAGFVREDFHFGAAGGAFEKLNPQISTILSRAVADHLLRSFSRKLFILITFYSVTGSLSMIWLIKVVHNIEEYSII